MIAIQLALAMSLSLERGTVDYVRTIPSVKDFTKPRRLVAKIVTFIAGPAEDKPEIVRPYATTHDSIGRLLVADPGQRGVHIFDFEKRKYQFLKGERKHPFASPIDVACDGADNIYVTDSARAVVEVFDAKGKHLRAIGAGELRRPTGMSLDRKGGRIFLTDTLRHQVMVYTTSGTLLRAIGRRGAGQVEFNYPTSLTFAAGKLHVVDAMNFRIQTLTPDGDFVGAFGELGLRSGTMNRPKGIAADSDGHLYLADALFETVQVFDTAGQLLYYFGSSGAAPGQFQLPSGVSIDLRDTIYVADSMNHRVQVFRYRRVAE